MARKVVVAPSMWAPADWRAQAQAQIEAWKQEDPQFEIDPWIARANAIPEPERQEYATCILQLGVVEKDYDVSVPNSTTVARRKRVHEELLRAMPTTLPLLVLALRDKGNRADYRRHCVAAVVAETKAAEAAPALFSVLLRPGDNSMAEAIKGLGVFPEKFIAPVGELLDHPDPSRRITGALLLRTLANHEVAFRMLEAKRSDPKVWSHYVAACGNRSDRESLEWLESTLQKTRDVFDRFDLGMALILRGVAGAAEEVERTQRIIDKQADRM
jgi:hypothetical protein